MQGMRKPRENKHNRVYHLISRIAHRAFFLSADERDRYIDIMKRSAAFSGVRLLAWCVMTNHVHILVYVPEPEELSDDALLSRMRTLYRKSRFAELKRLWDQLADVNPLKAKIVSSVESVSDYRWGSYHEACMGDADAVCGYDVIYGGHGHGWERLKESHMRTMREAAREIAAREAEEEGLSERSVPALVQEKREARRFMQMELKLPREVPHVIDEGSDAVALNVLKALQKGPMRPVELRDMLGIASRPYFTLHYLSPLAKAGFVEPVDAGNRSSCHSAYRLTRKGREFVKWH